MRKNAKLTTAESCTGGGIAEAITATAGSSQWFEYGYITYANKAKEQLLDVDQKILDSFGAVSEQVVEQMAAGALKIFRSRLRHCSDWHSWARWWLRKNPLVRYGFAG